MMAKTQLKTQLVQARTLPPTAKIGHGKGIVECAEGEYDRIIVVREMDAQPALCPHCLWRHHTVTCWPASQASLPHMLHMSQPSHGASPARCLYTYVLRKLRPALTNHQPSRLFHLIQPGLLALLAASLPHVPSPLSLPEFYSLPPVFLKNLHIRSEPVPHWQGRDSPTNLQVAALFLFPRVPVPPCRTVLAEERAARPRPQHLALAGIRWSQLRVCVRP